jgi:hypothetical protein
VAAYDAAREAEKQKAKEQEALNDAYQKFRQADQQSMQEYELYQIKQFREADLKSAEENNSVITNESLNEESTFSTVSQFINNRFNQIRDNIENHNYHLPKLISISFNPMQGTSFRSITTSVPSNPIANGFWQSIGYQEAELSYSQKGSVTLNSDALIDIDLNDYKVTLKHGKSEFFIQPFSMSFGWGTTLSNEGDNPVNKKKSSTIIDFDYFGVNAFSLKVSNITSVSTSTIETINDQKIETTNSNSIGGTMNIHRWTRPLDVVLVGVAGALTVGPEVVGTGIGIAVKTGVEAAVAYFSNLVPQLLAH